MKVLITADAVGGVWQYSLDLARGLGGLGIDSVIALMGPSATDAQVADAAAVSSLELIDTGLPLDWLAEDRSALRGAAREIARLVRSTGAQILQLNTPALAAETRFPVPVVAVQHSCVASWWEAVNGTDLPADFAWRTELVHDGLHTADAVVAPTAAFAAVTQRLYDLPEAPKAVHNGRTPLTVPGGAPHDFVFTAGRLWDQGKNLDTIDAAAERISVPVRAAGPLQGPNGASVIFEHLHCLGNLDEADLGRWLSAKPVFVSAALYEPFGLSVLEAAAAGCPLILSDIPTFRELWSDVAIFVAPRDEEGFTRAIGDLVCDDFERAVLGRAAQERAQLYTPQAMASQMATIYRGLLPAVQRPVLAALAAA